MKRNITVNWFLIILTLITIVLIIFAISTSLYFYSLYPDLDYGRTLMKNYEMYSLQWYSWVAVEAIKYIISAWPIFLWYAFYKKKISRFFFVFSLLLQLSIVVLLTVFHSNPAVSTILSTYTVRYWFIKGYRLVLAGFVLVKIDE